MEVTKRVELDMIGFDVGNDPSKQGEIALRWRKMIYAGNDLLATEYHRSNLNPLSDVSATLEAVYDDLEAQGYGRPPDTDMPYINAVTSLAWTDEVVAAYSSKMGEE